MINWFLSLFKRPEQAEPTELQLAATAALKDWARKDTQERILKALKDSNRV